MVSALGVKVSAPLLMAIFDMESSSLVHELSLLTPPTDDLEKSSTMKLEHAACAVAARPKSPRNLLAGDMVAMLSPSAMSSMKRCLSSKKRCKDLETREGDEDKGKRESGLKEETRERHIYNLTTPL